MDSRTAVTPVNLQTSSYMWPMLKDQAQVAVASGMLPQHIKTPQAAMFIGMKAMELGIPFTYGLSNIAVIGGKPVCGAELMLAIIYRDHGDDAIEFEETTDKVCTVSYKRKTATKRRNFSFTIEQATKAGLTGGNWTKYPAAMLRARCVSAVCRMAFSDSIAGMYLPEELGAAVTVTSEGEVVIDTQAQQAATETRQAEPGVPEAELTDHGRLVRAAQDAREAANVRAKAEGKTPRWNRAATRSTWPFSSERTAGSTARTACSSRWPTQSAEPATTDCNPTESTGTRARNRRWRISGSMAPRKSTTSTMTANSPSAGCCGPISSCSNSRAWRRFIGRPAR